MAGGGRTGGRRPYGQKRAPKPHFFFRQGEWAVCGPVFVGTGSTIALAWSDYVFWTSLKRMDVA